MRTAFILLLLTMITTSCGTSFYVAQMSSTDPYIEKDTITHIFRVKSDSLEITYSFYGENAPLRIEVFSKMKQYLLIDWRNSYFIFGDDDQNRINLAEFVDYRDHLTYLTPFTRDQRKLFQLSNLKPHKLDKKLFKKGSVQMSANQYRRVDIASFTEETTPLLMRGFLALRIGSPDAAPVIYPQEFYIQRIIKANGLQPGDLMAVSQQQGDYFYVRHVEGKAIRNIFKVTGTVLVGAAVVTTAIAFPDTEFTE